MSLQRKLVIGACVVLLGCGGRDRPAIDAGPARDAGALDAARPIDAGPEDDAGSAVDAGGADAGPADAGARDAGASDAGGPDDGGAALDASTFDGSIADASIVDGSIGDASIADGGTADAGPPVDGGPCIVPPASGSMVIDGALGGGASWYRPDDSVCPATALADIDLFAVSTYVLCGDGGTYRIRLEGEEASAALTLVDPYLVAYAGASIPADPLQCLDINDDEASGTTYASELPSVTVAAGSALTLAATSFDAIVDGGTGTFRLTITRL